MKTLPMEEITAAERQRKLFSPKPLDDLRDSIARHGLLHPIVIRRTGHENTIVCGERRLRAMCDLHNSNVLFNCDGAIVSPGEIPYIELTDLTDLQYVEAELEENILREDLTWQERNGALATIHRLRTEQNPDQQHGRSGSPLGPPSPIPASPPLPACAGARLRFAHPHGHGQ